MESDKNGKQPEKKPKLTRDGLKKALRLYSYVLPYKWRFILGMTFLSLGSLLFLVIMRTPGEFFNIINVKKSFYSPLMDR